MRSLKTTIYIALMIICMTGVSAYGGGGGYVWVFEEPEVESGNNLNHNTAYSAYSLEYKNKGDPGIIESYEFDMGGRYFNVYLDIFEVDKDNHDSGLSNVHSYLQIDSNVAKFENFNLVLKFDKPPIGTYQLYHEIDGKWVKEDLKLIKETDDAYYYDVDLTEFSMFAVIQEVTEPETTPIEKPAKPASTEIKSTTPTTQAPYSKESSKTDSQQQKNQEPEQSNQITGHVSTDHERTKGSTKSAIKSLLVVVALLVVIGLCAFAYKDHKDKKRMEKFGPQ